MHATDLSDLDRIDWADLHHAYGPAKDVPLLLRSLCERSARRRRQAWDELYASLLHQGSVYEATVEAVPFLLRMLATPEFPERGNLLRYLAQLAGTRPLADSLALSRAADDLEAPVDAQVRGRVAWGIPLYVRLLHDPSLQYPAAWLLCCFSESGRGLAPWVQELARASDAPAERATLIYGLGLLESPLNGLDEWLAEHLGAHPLERLAAALAIVRLAKRGNAIRQLDLPLEAPLDEVHISAAAVAALLAVLEPETRAEVDFDAWSTALPWRGHALESGALAARALAALPRSAREAHIDALIDVMGRAGRQPGWPHARPIALAMLDWLEPFDRGALDARQRALLQALAVQDRIWSHVYVPGALRARGLPDTPRKLERYLA